MRWRKARSGPVAVRYGRLRRWWLDQPVRIKGMMVLAVPLIALVGVTSSSLALQYNERQGRQTGIASSNLKNAGNQLLTDALNAETGVRGYAATGETLFLQPYDAAMAVMPRDLATLSAAAAAERDSASERAVAATATKVIADLRRLRSEISTGISSRALRQQLAAGKHAMDTLRRQIASLVGGPAARLLTSRNQISHMENEIDVLNIVGLVLGMLAGMIGGALFTSGISKRVAEAATNAGRLGAGQDLDPVHPAGDELGQLTDALSRAKGLLDSRAALLERRADELIAARDEALRATQAKNAFLSNTSHELRTPLNAVLGFTQLLQLSDLGQEDGESVERILAAGRHLLALINELIDIARIESGEFSLSVEPVRVNSLVEETCQLMAPLAAERSITIGQYCPEPGLAVHADRQRLGQILLNLVNNAIKYNRQDGAVSILCRSDGQDRVSVVVTDTGPGISDANLERIFVPFERLGAEQSGIEGTGIGLPLALALALAMGGQLSASSTVGEGASFTVTLPRAPDIIQVPDDAVPAARAVAASPGAGVVRVLYIEDNPANIEVVSRFVKSRPSIQLQSARSGRAGLERAIREVPDLVLLDLHLPDLGGYEVFRRLRAEPATTGIPIAILSAEAAPAVIRDMRDSGVISYLTKPLDLTELGQLLDSVTAGLNQVGAASRIPPLLRRRVELLGLGGAGQCHRLGVRRDRGRDQVEVAGAGLALVAGGGVAELLRPELSLLEPDVGGHALAYEARGQVEHRVVEHVESGQRDELEPVAHGGELLAEFRDRGLVQVRAPVERWRAVVGEQLVRIDAPDALGELSGHAEVRGGGLHPEQVGVRRVGQASGDARPDAVPDPVEPLRGAVAGDERPVPLVGVRGEQRRPVRVRARDHQRRHAAHIGRQPCRVQRADVLTGRDQHLAPQVPALLLRGELVLPVHPRDSGRDHGLHQLERVQHPAEPGFRVGDDRREPVRVLAHVAVRRLRPGDLVGAQQRVVDPAGHLRHRVDRVQALVRVGLPGQVRVRRHLPPGQVDGLEAGPHLLHRLVSRHRAERGDGVFGGKQLTQPLGTAPGQRVLLDHRAAQAHHVLRGVRPLDALPSGVGLPFLA